MITKDSIGSLKIDNLETNGLLGVHDSLAYRVAEIERHFHNRERWLGKALVPNGTVHVADQLGSSILPFQVVSGNNTWGNWVCVLGSSDTPTINGDVYFDPHRAVIVDANAVGAYFIQMTTGVDPTINFNLGLYSEFVYVTSSNQIDTGVIDLKTRRYLVGTVGWVRTMVPNQDAKTLDFYFGVHGYEG